jgi:hypothetical protein
MALVSPGVSISINDQSQYVNSNVGSVPLVILATAQDKTYNGSPATGTSQANAGALQSFTSQRDLVTALGTPTFQVSANGTPINASEINEYGLLTAYSAMGITNQLFAIRADIDLNQLTGTSIRPTGPEANGTNWLNLASTEFGIYWFNASTNSFSDIGQYTTLITNSSQVTTTGTSPNEVSTPKSSVGQQGTFALVFVNADGSTADVVRLFYKATAQNGAGAWTNQWVQVGSTAWQQSNTTVTGTLSPTSFTGGSLTINGVSVASTGTTPAALVTAINGASIPGITASQENGYVSLYVTNASTLTGSDGLGKLSITSDSASVFAACGISTSTSYYAPTVFYGNFSQEPATGWFASDSEPKPEGSIWWKTSATGTGWSPAFNQYNATTEEWVPQSVPMYAYTKDAIYGLDPVGGGVNITPGQIFAHYALSDSVSSNALRFIQFNGGSTASATGATPTSFTASQQFTISATAPGLNSSTYGTTANGSTAGLGVNTAKITTSGTTAQSFVSDILSSNLPYVTAQVNSNGTITITHTTGGEISLTPITTGVLANAGFPGTTATNIIPLPSNGTGSFSIANATIITPSVQYSATQPYANPTDGTLWYYSNPADVDIMINTGGAWAGYRTVSKDVRGYALTGTDPNGVIVTATTAPTSQSTGAALVAGDLWLDSGDLINYPSLYRYNGSSFVAIDNTDHTSNNSIVFADARWDSSGTTDPISGDMPAIAGLLLSSYIDEDAPDPRLYAKGTLLFNTRRSGFNVKKFESNYFNSISFPLDSLPLVPGAPSTLPQVAGTWVSASGLDETDALLGGSKAQRDLVLKAMAAAVNSNTDVLDSNYKFNLIVAPGYPELIPELVTLNDNRGDTAFVIGDTPLTLQPTVTELTNWSNNEGTWAGKGLATASPYLGVYYPAGLTTDLAGNSVVVPASHAALRTYLYNDQVSYPWFAPAGVKRGLVSNLNDIGYVDAESGEFFHNGINQGLRDALATLDINPIAQIPGVGLVIWGQSTRNGETSAQSSVNVVRLENYLRVIFASISNGYLFEPNDTITRKSIATQIEGALHNLLSLRGLYDFLVICDSSNNTTATIAAQQLYVDVAIEPMRDVEFIYIPIAIYNPGQIAALGGSST